MLQNKKLIVLILGIVVVAAIIGLLVMLNGDDEEKEDKHYTVAIVNIAPVLESVVTGFKEGMAEKGYIEGENLTILYDGPIARDAIDATLQKYIDQKVDLIVALATPVAVAAQKLTVDNKIPVVFVPVTDPVAAGIVTDLKQPGANLTGIMTGQGEARRLEWLHTLAPDAKRILLPYNPADQSPVQSIEAMKPAAETLELELVLVETPDADAVQALIDNLPEDIDAIFLPSDSLVGSLFTAWAAKAAELGLPTSASTLSHVEGGILSSYSYNPRESGKQASRLADQIFTGTQPGDLPVETAELFLSLNLKAAEAMGYEITDEMLRQAQIIIRE
ncbi:MAG: ABC transporter substrate-binding protein [Chloroflexi bacterium]|nr:ABC transporter substrate-binding protein [Chloroflexota bacterium]